MQFPAPLAVTVEIRALDVGARLDRAWRLSRELGEDGLRLGTDLPWEAGRPVRVSLRLPGDPPELAPLEVTGSIMGIPPDDEETEGEAARPRVVLFTALADEARLRIARYVQERMLLT